MSQEHNVEEQAEAILKCVKNADNDAHALSMIKTNLTSLNHSHTEELEQARREEREKCISIVESIDTGFETSFNRAYREMKKKILQALTPNT